MAKAWYNTLKKEYDDEKAYANTEIKFLEQFLKIHGDDIDKNLSEELEEELDEYKEELKDLSNDIIGRSGKYVWVGTKKAIENSRK